MIFVDKKFRLPRIWSNKELKKFAHLFKGNVINISGVEDKDKEGLKYADYFTNANSYCISNWKTEAQKYKEGNNEILLDLTKRLDRKLINKFDVVFNHTTLEHIYNVKEAFKNLCLLSKDIVIIVVPFLQQMHLGKDYGDYWRFTPLCIKNLFNENNYKLLYLSFNNHNKSSIYIFAIASKRSNLWKNMICEEFNFKCKKDFLDPFEGLVGCMAIKNSFLLKIKLIFNYLFSKIIK